MTLPSDYAEPVILPGKWHCFGSTYIDADNGTTEHTRYCERLINTDGTDIIVQVAYRTRMEDGDSGKPLTAWSDYHDLHIYRRSTAGDILVQPFTDYDRWRCIHERGRSFYQFSKCPVYDEPGHTTGNTENDEEESQLDTERDEED